jgi:peptidoglycan/LPS O-acetylase OafA/YrhL
VFTLTYNYQIWDKGVDLIYFWSLNVEEHFYLVLPFVLLLLAPRPRLRLAFFSIVAVLVAAILRPLTLPATATTTADFITPGVMAYWQHHFATHARLDTLLAGVAIALASNLKLIRRPAGTAWLRSTLLFHITSLVAVLALVFIHRFLRWDCEASWIIVDVSSIALVTLATFQRGLVLPFGGAIFEYLGARAYTIYLLHLPTYHYMIEIMQRHPVLKLQHSPYEIMFVYCLLTLTSAELCYRFIERPLTLLGREIKATSPDYAPVRSIAPPALE